MPKGRCTERQARVLEKHGYNPNVSFDRASEIIQALRDNDWERPDGESAPRTRRTASAAPTRRRTSNAGGRRSEKSYAGPATRKQVGILEKYGYNADRMSFKEASKLIDRIANNGWKRPDYDDDDNFSDDRFDRDDDLYAEDDDDYEDDDVPF